VVEVADRTMEKWMLMVIISFCLMLANDEKVLVDEMVIDRMHSAMDGETRVVMVEVEN